MKPEDYNPKAKEAFGKSLIDVGVAIFKGLMVLFTVVPASIVVKSVLEGDGTEVSIYESLGSMTNATYYTFLGIVLIAFLMGHYFRNAGLRYLHQVEEAEKENITNKSSSLRPFRPSSDGNHCAGFRRSRHR